MLVRCSATVLAIMTVVSASAGITAWCPAQGEYVPFYFSGTKGIASGSVSTNAGILVSMRLYLNNNLDSSCDWVPGNVDQYNGSLRVMFDRSHFAPGSLVTVKMVGFNSANERAEATKQIIVRNRSVALNLREFWETPGGSGAGIVTVLMGGKGYDQVYEYQGWSPVNCLGHMANSGVWYVATHGSSAYHDTDASDPDPPVGLGYGDRMGTAGPEANGYEAGREYHNGARFPPFNFSGRPHVAFVMFDSCHSGSTDLFDRIMFPYYDGYDLTYCKDQSVLGWPGCTFDVECENTSWWIFHRLTTGATATQAVMHLIQNNPGNNRPVHIHSMTNLVDSLDEITLLGGPHTRMKGVYTGNSMTGANTWFRSIQ